MASFEDDWPTSWRKHESQKKGPSWKIASLYTKNTCTPVYTNHSIYYILINAYLFEDTQVNIDISQVDMNTCTANSIVGNGPPVKSTKTNKDKLAMIN